MDWELAIKEEREVLKRIVALFYALAALTDSAAGRSRPVRCFVLWILRPAMAIALDYMADAGPVQEALLRERNDSIAEARRYSRCFRAAARSMKGLLRALDRCEAPEEAFLIFADRHLPEPRASFGFRFVSRDLLASINSLVQAGDGLRQASATGPPLLERRDWT